MYYYYHQYWVDKQQVCIDNITYSFIHPDIWIKNIGEIIHIRHTKIIMDVYKSNWE